MRWIIEQLFRSMKSHCLQIEDSPLEDVRCFRKLAMIGLTAATRAMQPVMARDGGTGQPVTDAADPAEMPALRAISATLEGRTEKLKNPHGENTLAWYAWIVARQGGWSGYTSRGYRPPGPKTMHHGLLRLDPILAGWRLAERSGSGVIPAGNQMREYRSAVQHEFVPRNSDSCRALPGVRVRVLDQRLVQPRW
jgi:hypothetical protein